MPSAEKTSFADYVMVAYVAPFLGYRSIHVETGIKLGSSPLLVIRRTVIVYIDLATWMNFCDRCEAVLPPRNLE